MAHAWSSDVPAPHFRFIYNSSWADSAGLMYNALWARLLGAEALFPDFYAKFQAHYAQYASRTANATWCLPLSSMEHDSKWDWLMHTAALMFTNSSGGGGGPQPSAYSQLVIDQLYTFANTTSSRFPLTDHPECTGAAPPAAAADRARPVMGALYAPMLVAAPSPAVAKERARLAAFLAAQGSGRGGGEALAGSAAAPAAAPPSVLSFFAASDTHLGHDVVTQNGTRVTSYEKNVWAIEEMNTLAGAGCRGACAWPAALGGGAVAPPRGVTISGDLIDSGASPETEVNGCAQWNNFTALYGLNGTDGMLQYRTYEGRGNHVRGAKPARPPPPAPPGHTLTTRPLPPPLSPPSFCAPRAHPCAPRRCRTAATPPTPCRGAASLCPRAPWRRATRCAPPTLPLALIRSARPLACTTPGPGALTPRAACTLCT